jgi:nicotinate-nucleotide--dimethylbenzimidazole phosphoribosyltransferase
VIRELLADLANAPGPSELHQQAVTQRAARILRPSGALARLDYVAAWLAGWQRTDVPEVAKPSLILAAGNHGVVEHGVSSRPAQVTAAVVDAIKAGVATSAVMAERLGVTLRLVDAGVALPAGNIVTEDALTVERFEHLIELGRETVAMLDTDLVLLGEVGVGNTTPSAAVAAVLSGGEVDDFVGAGAALDEDGRLRKRDAVLGAMDRIRGAATPMEVLRRVGGGEHAVLAGAVIEARLRSLPVLVDGFATTAAVAPLQFAVPGSLSHCLAAHLSAEKGHARLLEAVHLTPLLDLEMKLGEGSGALAALPIVRLAAACVVDVATLEEWGLS